MSFWCYNSVVNICSVSTPATTTVFLSTILSGIFEWWYYSKKADIFDWTPEHGSLIKTTLSSDSSQKVETWKDKKDIYKDYASKSWKIYRVGLEFLCLFVGWNLFIYTIQMIYYSMNHSETISWNMLLLLIVGIVGIAGRLPELIDSVRHWFSK